MMVGRKSGRVCLVCGEPIYFGTYNRKTCSKKCKHQFYLSRNAPASKDFKLPESLNRNGARLLALNTISQALEDKDTDFFNDEEHSTLFFELGRIDRDYFMEMLDTYGFRDFKRNMLAKALATDMRVD